MILWNETGTSFFVNWWWIIPLICILLCIWMCRFSGRHMKGGGWCCMMGHRRDDLDELKKEVRELKERIGPAK